MYDACFFDFKLDLVFETLFFVVFISASERTHLTWDVVVLMNKLVSLFARWKAQPLDLPCIPCYVEMFD